MCDRTHRVGGFRSTNRCAAPLCSWAMLRASLLLAVVLAALSATTAHAGQRVVGTIEGPASPDGASLPVILVPGFLGWRDLDVLGSYFIGLEDALEKAGADVY